ncbi:MFS transporter [Arhodomonas sp. SL1]|uniref:MFS transporter n=1 Tax=Arhodomonas sp. SL1 TaxID=3425691 RepID=UPI003F8846CD
MTRLSPLGTAVLGSGIIAITYGLARFVFGLFLPAIREDMGLTPVMAGFIGALPFASFITAIVVAPFLARTLGLRHAAALTAGFALLGLLAIAQAPGPLILAAGVVTCGISTGLSSPIMAQAVATTVKAPLRGRVNATVNAGTSFGIAVAVVVVLLGSGAWRSAYLGFAVLAALGLAAAMRWLPGVSTDAAGAQPTKPGREQWREIARLSGLAAAMGFTSAIYWVFAPDFAIHGGGLDSGTGAWMWLTVGCVGLAGGTVGDLIERYGAARTHAGAFALLGTSLLLLAAAPDGLISALASAAAFGAAYMALTGFYLVRSIEILADHPALGPVLPLIATSSGQVMGSPVGGWLISTTGYATAFTAFAVLGLMGAVVSVRLAAAGPVTVPSPAR